MKRTASNFHRGAALELCSPVSKIGRKICSDGTDKMHFAGVKSLAPAWPPEMGIGEPTHRGLGTNPNSMLGVPFLDMAAGDPMHEGTAFDIHLPLSQETLPADGFLCSQPAALPGEQTATEPGVGFLHGQEVLTQDAMFRELLETERETGSRILDEVVQRTEGEEFERVADGHPAWLTELAHTKTTAIPVVPAQAEAEQEKKDFGHFRVTKDRVTWYCKQMSKKQRTKATQRKYWAAPWSEISDEGKRERTVSFRRNTTIKHTPKQKSDLIEYEEYLSRPRRCGRKEVTSKVQWHLSGRGFMFTLIGKWSAVPWPETSDGDSRKFNNLEEVVEYVKSSEGFQEYWPKAIQHLKEEAAAVQANCVTITAELCTNSMAQESVLRWHVHAMSNRSDNVRLYMKNIRDFEGTHVFAKACLSTARGKECSLQRGHYYCAADKKGTITSIWSRSCCPFSSYPVQGYWIAGLWMKGKMTSAQAKLDHLRSGQKARQWIENMEWCDEKLEEIRMEQHIAQLRNTFDQDLGPLKKPAKVTEWERQYLHRLKRYKFLVLEGKSKTGKTCLAKRLEHDHLEVGCANTQTPSLKRFKFFKHRLIFFDEASPQMVVKNKKLFQAGESEEECGASNTGCHSYYRCFAGTKLVIASNNWSSQLALMSEEDREWIEENQIHVYINPGDLY